MIVQISAVVSDVFGAFSTKGMRSVMAIYAVVQLDRRRVRGSPHWS